GHYRSLGVKFRLRGLPYERCAELSWILGYLDPLFKKKLRLLDIGSGESPLPTILFKSSCWDVTCLDKYSWVQKQHRFVKLAAKEASDAERFHVIQGDLLNAQLPDAPFDIITSVSVIEHFEGNSDSAAMRASARLLRPGGQYILTTLINEPFFKEFSLNRSVYGAAFRGAPVFYQRHYDLHSLEQRIIQPSGLLEKQRIYFGDYGFQCFEKILQRPKPLRALYLWATPWFARRYLAYGQRPISRKGMRMNTASGVILVLEKPAQANGRSRPSVSARV